MFTVKYVLLVCLGLVSQSLARGGVPGKALLWSHHHPSSQTVVKAQHITKTLEAKNFGSFLKKEYSGYDVVAVLAPAEGGSILSNDAISTSFQASPHQVTLSNIYQSEGTTVENAISSETIDEKTFAEFKEILKQEKVSPGPFKVVVNSGESLAAILGTEHIKKKVLFVAYDEPTAMAPATSSSFEPRALDEEEGLDQTTSSSSSSSSSDAYGATQTSNSSSIYYKPEGTEWSMYYADTYLYMTPDIFTGLMTGLFMFFVILVGLGCLNQVQGITYFYDKLPAVGKEA